MTFSLALFCQYFEWNCFFIQKKAPTQTALMLNSDAIYRDNYLSYRLL